MDSTPHSSPVNDVLRYDIKTRCYRKLEKLGQTRKNFLSVMFFLPLCLNRIGYLNPAFLISGSGINNEKKLKRSIGGTGLQGKLTLNVII